MGIGYLLGKKKKYVEIAPPPEEKTGKIYGVRVNRFTSNTSNRVIYTDDSVDFTPANGNNGNFLYGSWENEFPFNKIKPCLLTRDGVVNGYLNKDNYNYYEDGTPAVIVSSAVGSVMIEIPKVYYKFQRISPTSDMSIQYSDTKHDDTWVCYAHTDMNGVEKDHIYISAYQGSGTGSIMFSSSGQQPTVSKTLTDLTAMGKGLGDGFEVLGHHQLTLLQLLYLIMFKNTNSYAALGLGAQTNGPIATGSTNQKGLFYGSQNNTESVKFMGIEDIYGNVDTFVQGIHLPSDRFFQLYGVTKNYKDSTSGIMLDIYGSSDMGFIASDAGTVSTYRGLYYYGLSASSTTNRYATFGGGGTSTTANDGGMFRYPVNISASSSSSTRGSRIMYV